MLFFIEGKDNTVGVVSMEADPNKIAVPIPVISLPDLLAEKDIADYSLVADIEGAELSFIFEYPEALASCRECIIELHESIYEEKKVTVDQQIQQLEKLGFQIIDRHGPVIFARK